MLFVFINTFVISTILAYDRKAGIIGRMLSTPTPPRAVLLGLGLSKLAFALVQSAVLVGVGHRRVRRRVGRPGRAPSHSS